MFNPFANGRINDQQITHRLRNALQPKVDGVVKVWVAYKRVGFLTNREYSQISESRSRAVVTAICNDDRIVRITTAQPSVLDTCAVQEAT